MILALPKLAVRFPHHAVVDEFKPEGGNLYRLFIPPNIVHDHALVLLENGREVGERIPLYEASRIIEEGGGLYAQGDDRSTTEYRYLYFSASDNSDPRTNQYVYELVYNPSVFRLGLLTAFWTALAAAGAFKQVYEWKTGDPVMAVLELHPVRVLYDLLYGTIIAAIFAYGLLLRYKATLIPLLHPDSMSYLGAAFGANFDLFRGYPYPFFLKLCLDAFADFKALSLAQYGLGLATAIFLLAAWRKTRPQAPGRLLQLVHDGLGLLLLISWYISRTTIYYEKAVLVESFLIFLMALLLYVLAAFAMQARRGNSGRSLALTASGAAVVNVLAIQTHSRWGLGMLIVALIILLFVIISPITRQTKTGVLISFVIVSTLLMFLPQRFLISGYRDRGSAAAVEQLLFIHLDIVDRQLAQDLDDPGYEHFDRALLADFHAQNRVFFDSHDFKDGMLYSSEMAALGMYSSDGPIEVLLRYFEDDWGGYARFCRRYFLRTIRNQPWAYLSKVTAVLKGFYLGQDFYSDLTLEDALGDNLDYETLYMDNSPERLQDANADFFSQAAMKADDKLPYSPKSLFIEWVYLLNISFRPIVFAALACCGLIIFARRRVNRLIPLVIFFILAALLHFSQTLTIAMSHSFGVYRYGETIRLYSLFCQASGLMLLLAAAAGLLEASNKNLRI